MTKAITAVMFICVVVMIGVSVTPSTSGVPPFNASNFKKPKENRYFPLRPGTAYHYKSVTSEGIETNKFVVTHSKKKILGVFTTVVHDRAFLNGDLIEDTFDWFANDRHGNVWYFGEESRDIENGQVVSTAGSWEAGKNNALPGIIMLAKPKVGVKYHQEFAPGIAEDTGEVLSLNKSVSVPTSVMNAVASMGLVSEGSPFFWLSLPVPASAFKHCLKTLDLNPFEPDVKEHKYYAPGVGLVLEVNIPEGEPTETKRITKIVRN